jgi:Secretion system C-terminal sorting domain
MKKYLIIIALFAYSFISKAQSSAIFLGGVGDGISTQSSTQTYTDFRIGGVGDGAANNNYTQAYNDVRKGAAGDGWINNNYTQSYKDVRTGGLGDGWTAQLAVLPLTPLGIELLSFTGQQQAGADVLNWNTLNEKNVAHFIVEHGANSFSYVKIGEVNAVGNTTGSTDYTYTNNNPENGHNFYRLKMVNEDGTFNYSNVILLKTTINKSTISMFPNPAATQININVASIIKIGTQINVFDVHGKIMYQQQLEAGKGATSIDVQAWARGNYMVQIIQGTDVNTIKLVKQ